MVRLRIIFAPDLKFRGIDLNRFQHSMCGFAVAKCEHLPWNSIHNYACIEIAATDRNSIAVLIPIHSFACRHLHTECWYLFKTILKISDLDMVYTCSVYVRFNVYRLMLIKNVIVLLSPGLIRPLLNPLILLVHTRLCRTFGLHLCALTVRELPICIHWLKNSSYSI